MDKKLSLDTSTQYLKGCGPKLGELLTQSNINTIRDLLYHLPSIYSRFQKDEALGMGEDGLVELDVTFHHIRKIPTRRGKLICELHCDGPSGQKVILRYFSPLPWLFKIEKGSKMRVSGKTKKTAYGLEFAHPKTSSLSTQREIPITSSPSSPTGEESRIYIRYPETGSVKSSKFADLIQKAIEICEPHPNAIPFQISEKLNLMNTWQSLKYIHNPPMQENVDVLNGFRSPAHKTLIFEEFFNFFLKLFVRKEKQQKNTTLSIKNNEILLKEYISTLPFILTGAQERVIQEVIEDMSSGLQMHRMIQGDVGSGKTIVSILCGLLAVDQGIDVALMAPTEILAEQHYRNAKELFPHQKVHLFTQNKKTFDGELLEGIVFGTHALFQKSVQFKNLGLVIVDEQHRFGVKQRSTLVEKGIFPHLLVMTATPIPRSLSMTLYGELSLSIIDEVPPHRSKVQTMRAFPNQRQQMRLDILECIKKKEPVFIVFPLTQESENLDLLNAADALDEYRDLFPKASVEMLHGKMKNIEKEAVVKKIVDKKVDILIATTIIEVGIDVPEASVMIIEHANRYGLSQLHQLRGRVGRGDKPGKCYLVIDKSAGEIAHRRMEVMLRSNNGFEIAEEDLAIRGPGDFFGTRQSGLPSFHFADIVRDIKILERAKKEAALYFANAKVGKYSQKTLPTEFTPIISG